MEWLAQKEVPFVIVFTKADKLTKTALAKNLDAYREEMLKTWEELPQMFVTSAAKPAGKDQILALVEETNKTFQK
jgi:GTP-binding protein